MAFLQLKKKYHMDKPLSIQLLTSPIDVIAEMNDFDTMEYKFKVKNAGGSFLTKEEDSYSIKNGGEFDFIVSEALYKHLSIYEKDSFLKVLMKKVEDPKNRAGFVWEVKPISADSVTLNKPSDTDLAIKWGMAFNNATRLVSSISLHTDESIEDRVGLIGKLTPEMFKIACNMPDQKPKENDDIPF